MIQYNLVSKIFVSMTFRFNNNFLIFHEKVSIEDFNIEVQFESYYIGNLSLRVNGYKFSKNGQERAGRQECPVGNCIVRTKTMEIDGKAMIKTAIGQHNHKRQKQCKCNCIYCFFFSIEHKWNFLFAIDITVFTIDAPFKLNRKGNIILFVNGQFFTKNGKQDLRNNNKLRWKCTNTKCPVTAETIEVNGKIMMKSIEKNHNH